MRFMSDGQDIQVGKEHTVKYHAATHLVFSEEVHCLRRGSIKAPEVEVPGGVIVLGKEQKVDGMGRGRNPSRA